MTNPLTAPKMVAALKAEGVRVTEPYPSWATRNRTAATGLVFGPVVGIVIHHTAGSKSQSLVYNGRSDLPGPLCHAYAPKDGTVAMISSGRSNHAGRFSGNAHSAVVKSKSGGWLTRLGKRITGRSFQIPVDQLKTPPRPVGAETVDANDAYYGIEIENRGDGHDFYTAAQYTAVVRWAAAICRAHGWTAQRIIGHKEGTARKPDPRGPIGSASGAMWSMDRFRIDVQNRLNGTVTPAPTKPAVKPAAPKPPAPKPAVKPVNKPVNKPKPAPIAALSRLVRPGKRHAQVATLQRLLIAAGYGPIKGAPSTYYGPNTQAAVVRFHNRHPSLKSRGVSKDPAIGPSGWAILNREAKK